MTPPPDLPPARAVPLGEARRQAARLLARLERNESALRLAVGGQARRMAPFVERLELLATAHDAEPMLEALTSAPQVAGIVSRAARVVSVRLDSGLEVRLELLDEEGDFGPALVRATGPAEHVALLEARARSVGLSWVGATLTRDGARLTLTDEDEVYACLGLDRPPPEQRERHLPGALVEEPLAMHEVLGAAGLHLRPGAGRYSLPEMAARAEREGYAWSLPWVPASDRAARAAAAEALHAWNDAPETRAPARLLLVTERGEPRPSTTEEPQPLVMGRLAGACEPRLTADDAWLGEIDALWLDVPAEGASAPAPPGLDDLLVGLARRQVALAVAPPPHHLRPEPDVLVRALALRVPLLLLAQAHDLVSVDDLVLSVGLARRAGAQATQVLNTRSLGDLDAWLAARRRRGGSDA